MHFLLVTAGALAAMALSTVACAQIAARTPATTAVQGAAVAPTYVAAGAVAANAAAITPGLPAGIAMNDILLLFVETANQAATITNQNGGTWAEVTNGGQGSPQSTGTANTAAATRLTVFWSRYNGSQGAPTVGDSGDHQLARMIAVRGVVTTGNPWDVTAGGVEANNTDNSGSIPGTTTTVTNTFVVAAIATALPATTGTAVFSAVANANLTGVTERTDNSTNAGTAGSGQGGGLGVFTGVMATAGNYGATTVTTSANTAKAMISIALRPAVISTMLITKPTGTVTNDVMVASIAFRLNSPGTTSQDIVVTAPAGWTLANPGRLDQLNSTSSGLAVYTKVATAAEPANYTWTFTCANTCATLGFHSAAGGMVSFSGVNTTTPVDAADGAPTGSATLSPATPSISTTTLDAMLVTAHSVGNAGTWAAAPPSGMTQAYQLASGSLKLQVSTALQSAAGATGTKTATDAGPDAADFGNAHILALRPLASSFNQSAYRLFRNVDSTDVGTALAAANTAATLPNGGAAFRLRMLIHVGNGGIAAGGQAFKLQFAVRSGTCDTAFAGETYADVTTSSVIAFNNNSPADGANLTANANDPTHGADTVVDQTYVELNNFTNSSAISVGRDGKWDFSLIDNGAPAGTTYCFRAVRDTGAVLNTYTVVPQITTRASVFYFHNATTPNLGTLPGATTLSAIAPNVTATGAGTNRDLNQVIGTAAVDAPLTTLASTALQRNWFRRFISRPLAAQTLPTGVWTFQGAAFENNAASNMLVWGGVIKVWRPSTGAVVATLLDDPQLGATEPGTGSTLVTTNTASIAGVAVAEGDVLVVELWAENTQGNATARTNTIRYDGTTEGNTTTTASYLQAPGTIFFSRGVYQTAYRFFNNLDSTDVGTAMAALNTPATLGATGTSFRLRALLHVADIDLVAGGQAFKLQFAAKGGGTCTAPAGAYADVTAATVIAFNNNSPADGASLTANANDPTHGADTVVNQTYEELNNFTNIAAIIAGQDGKWDFALKDNGAPGATTYCFRVVKDTGTALPLYTVYPEITTAAGIPTPGSFNAFETSTGSGAITGVIRTKVAGTAFSLDVVSIESGAQQAGFTDAVTVELLGNNTLGVSLDAQNCPTSSTPLQTVSPTITKGRSTVNFTAVAESWRDVRVRMRWPTGSPSVTWCSTDNFAIRPSSLASFEVRDNDWQTAGTGRLLDDMTFTAPAAGKVHKAGRPFSVRATAVNSAAVTTTNYVGAPSATFSTCAGAACTPTFGALTLTTTFAAGQLVSDVASYNNVGSFALRLEDTSFASVDSGDTSADCTASGRYVCSSTINVGRFVPDHFAVAVNAPEFGPACSGLFSYVGQTFTYTTPPVITVTARNFADTDATFYADNTKWWRINSASLTGKSYTALSGTLNTGGAPGTDPVIVAAGSGAGTLTFGSGTGFLFTRTTPVSPFNAEIALAINVIDADGVSASSNPVQFGAASAGNGIAFTGNNKGMRFGRLSIGNTSGSPALPLLVPVEAQYWSGQAFITNSLDSCTPISASALGSDVAMVFAGAVSPAPTCKTAISNGGTLTSGRRSLRLSAPTGNASGNATLTVNIGAAASGTTCVATGATPATATTANRSYLQGGTGFNQNPSGRATFGVYKGSDDQIHRQENF